MRIPTESPQPDHNPARGLFPNDLRFVGDGTEQEYETRFQNSWGISFGRMGLLLNVISSYGVDEARAASDEQVRKLLQEDIFTQPEKYHNGSVGYSAFRTGGYVPGQELKNPILNFDGRAWKLSQDGLIAFRDLAANYQGGDVSEPDLDNLRRRLADVEEQLRSLRSATDRSPDGIAPIGHNGPPPDHVYGIPLADIDEVLTIIPAVNEETLRPDVAQTANRDLIKIALDRFQRMAGAVGGFIAEGGKVVGKAVAGEVAKDAWKDPHALLEKLGRIVLLLTHFVRWLFHAGG